MTTEWKTQGDWDRIAAARKAKADELQAALDAYLTGREGWGCWEGNWSSNVFSAPGEIHTRRHLRVVVYKEAIVGEKTNGFAPCDIAEFTDPAEAVAWAEQPRSKDSIQHRRAMAEIEAYARRNDVNLDGLKGTKVDSGLAGGDARNHFDVIEFEGITGRVRITTLSDGSGYRVAYNRRHRLVPADGLDKAVRAKAVADVIREMTDLAA